MNSGLAFFKLQQTPEGGIYTLRKQMVGSAPTEVTETKATEKQFTIYATPQRVEDENLKRFIKIGYLDYNMVHLYYNTIIIVPSSETLDKLEKEVQELLKKNNIEPDTVAASKLIAQSGCKFKDYIFDFFVKDTEHNLDYKVNPDFPYKRNDTIIKRMNKLSNIFYFDFRSANEIYCSTKWDMAQQVKLELLAMVNSSFILRGELPSHQRGGLFGGCTQESILTKRDLYDQLLEKYKSELEASEEFIATIIKNVGSNPVLEFLSADIVNSAIAILMTESISDDITYVPLSREEIHAELAKITEDYKQIKVETPVEVIKQAMEDYGEEEFYKKLVDSYNKNGIDLGILHADIVSALIMDRPGLSGLKYALGLIDRLKEGSNENSIVYRSFCEFPYTNKLARQYFLPYFHSTPSNECTPKEEEVVDETAQFF